MKKLFYTLCIVLITNLGASAASDQKASFEKGCNEGNIIACYNLGIMHDEGYANLIEDDNKAIELYLKACDSNYYDACSRAAFLYEEGNNVELDMKKAFKLYAKACGGNDGYACHNVAVYLSKNENQAIKKLSINFYDKACTDGYADSCIIMGRIYRDSKSLTRDYKKAKEKFEMACELNNRLGCKEVRILEGLGI